MSTYAARELRARDVLTVHDWHLHVTAAHLDAAGREEVTVAELDFPLHLRPDEPVEADHEETA